MVKIKGENKTKELIMILSQRPRRFLYLKDLEKTLNIYSKKMYLITRILNLKEKIIIHEDSYKKNSKNKRFVYTQAKIKLKEILDFTPK